MVLRNRAIYQDRHTRILIVARKTISNQRSDTFVHTGYRGLPLQSGGRPHIHASHDVQIGYYAFSANADEVLDAK